MAFGAFSAAQERAGQGSRVGFTQETRRVELETGERGDERQKPDAQAYGNWQTVNSSWIASLRYNRTGEFAQMMVRKRGRIYTFGGMLFATFYSWFNAPSKGRYFNKRLKGRYHR